MPAAAQRSTLPRTLLLALMVGIIWSLAAHPGWAVQPDEVLADPALEARARTISQDLRCLVCQNQSIDDSNAPLARDLRVLVRERLKAGDSDSAAVAFITDRYGDFARLNPPFQANTWLLWLGPFATLLAAAVGVALHLRRRRGNTVALPSPLTPEEQVRLRTLLGREG